jgi:hypothetical protein
MATTPDPLDAYQDPRDNEAEALRLIRAIHAGEPPEGVAVGALEWARHDLAGGDKVAGHVESYWPRPRLSGAH